MKFQNNSEKSILLFSVLVLVFSIPFYILGSIGPNLSAFLPLNLPLSALMVVSPLLVTFFLVYKTDGTSGIKNLLKNAFDYKGIKNISWIIISIVSMPLVILGSYVTLKIINPSIPNLNFSIISVFILFLLFFIPALCEEIGWMGYLMEPVQQKMNALMAGLSIGLIWAIWHIIPYMQLSHDIIWIIWQCIATIGMRVIIVWLYNNNGKNLLVTILFHTMINVSITLMPTNGFYYDPVTTGIYLSVFVGIIAYLFGTKTLSYFKFTKSNISMKAPISISGILKA